MKAKKLFNREGTCVAKIWKFKSQFFVHMPYLFGPDRHLSTEVVHNPADEDDLLLLDFHLPGATW